MVQNKKVKISGQGRLTFFLLNYLLLEGIFFIIFSTNVFSLKLPLGFLLLFSPCFLGFQPLFCWSSQATVISQRAQVCVDQNLDGSCQSKLRRRCCGLPASSSAPALLLSADARPKWWHRGFRQTLRWKHQGYPSLGPTYVCFLSPFSHILFLGDWLALSRCPLYHVIPFLVRSRSRGKKLLTGLVHMAALKQVRLGGHIACLLVTGKGLGIRKVLHLSRPCDLGKW